MPPLDLDEDDDQPQGEMIDLDLPDDDVEDTPDGGAIVKLDTSPKRGDSEFLTNLAETLATPELSKLSTNLIDAITRDKEARAKRDKQYEEGIRRTGMGDDAPGGAQFEGASKVVHPLLTEVCVDFSSRAMKELWPAEGPAKSMIVGDETRERVAKASRKAALLNNQMTVQNPGARAEFEQLLTQLPLGGGQYLKVTWDTARNRPSHLFVPIDDIYLPYAATNFHSAQRKTHVQYLTQLDYRQRVDSGMYRDVDLSATGMLPDQTRAARANDKIEGRDASAYNEDGLRTVFEIYTTCEIAGDEEADGKPAPYIITIDKDSNSVLSIYRNWDEDDASREELEWIVEFPFVPWRGAYPIGMIHMIGGLSAAATGALRALLDSAHISNSQAMLKLKGGSRGGQSLVIEPGQVAEIEGGINVDDIRKLAMPLPYNPPSQVLFSLLGFVVEAAKGVVQTTLSDMGDSTENTPVGTTLARIEQGTIVYSAIHARMHAAMARVLGVMSRLNALYLDDAEEKDETGSLLASRADFNGPLDVVPVSDPHIFSEAQRFAQVQAVAQRAQLNPDLYDRRKVEERILSTLKLPNATDLLVPKQTPTEENAVAENVKATLGRPIVAFPSQDHVAHLKTHLAYMNSPVFGMSQIMAQPLLPIMVQHIKEHLALWYADEVMQTASDAHDEDFGAMLHQIKSKEDKQALDRLVAEASLNVVATAGEVWTPRFQESIAAAIQKIQQTAPQPPMDPAVKVAADDVAMRAQVAAAKDKTDQAKIADSAAERASEAQRDEMREQHEDARAEAANATQLELKGKDAEQARTDAILDFAAATHATTTGAQVDQHAAQLGAATDVHATQTQAQTALDTMPPPAPATPQGE